MAYTEDPDELKIWEVITTLRQQLEDEGKYGVAMGKREKPVMASSSQKTTNSLVPDNTKVQTSMASKEKIHLVDAGLMINSPYPPVLRTERDVDLIISLDFSAGDPFETVFSAKQYMLQRKLPFPPVKESVWEEKNHLQDCYVFEGRRPEEPTIMHMPLFNLQNCKDEEEIQKEWEKYTTLQQHYGACEIEHLVEKAKENLKNNKDRILEQIIMAVKRRKDQKSLAQ